MCVETVLNEYVSAMAAALIEPYCTTATNVVRCVMDRCTWPPSTWSPSMSGDHFDMCSR